MRTLYRYGINPCQIRKQTENPVLIKNGSDFEKDLVFCPRILKNIDGSPYTDGDGKYWLYYTGGYFLATGSADQMGLAKSTDLINWTRAGKVMGFGASYDSADVMPVTVVKDGSTFKCWYIGNAHFPPIENSVTICYATSTDGVNWTKNAGNPILTQGTGSDAKNLYAPAVLKDGNTYKMWYAGHSSPNNYGLMYATSPDGITWTKYSNSYIWTNSRNILVPSEVWKNDGIYWMTFHGGTNIEIAYSHDGITWNKYKDLLSYNPLSWDSAGLDFASQIEKDGKWYTLYAGFTANWAAYSIGVAVSCWRIGEPYPANL